MSAFVHYMIAHGFLYERSKFTGNMCLVSRHSTIYKFLKEWEENIVWC